MHTAEALLEGKKNRETDLFARIIPCCFGTAVQPPGLLKAHQGVRVYYWTYPLPGNTHSPWHLPGKSTGQYPHCPRDQGKRARCLVQTHDGRLAPVTVPTAWAGQGREWGGEEAWHRAPATGKVGTGGT